MEKGMREKSGWCTLSHTESTHYHNIENTIIETAGIDLI
jgi:hypothetical protein